MIELLTGFVLTLTSLLIGYSLGKNQEVVPTDMKKQISQIFRKVVPNPDVGPIERPTAQDNFYRDNPQIAKEHKIMGQTFDTLNKK